MNRSKRTKKLVYAAIFTALCCVATLSIQIPIPGTAEFIHPGDAFVILAGVFLGPLWGGLAAGVGSALANLIGGHFIWMPATLVIKGLIGFLAGLVYHKLNKKNMTIRFVGVGIGGIIDIILVVGGYFIYGSFIMGVATASLGVFWNMIQGLSGLILAVALYPLLRAVPDLRYGENKLGGVKKNDRKQTV